MRCRCFALGYRDSAGKCCVSAVRVSFTPSAQIDLHFAGQVFDQIFNTPQGILGYHNNSDYLKSTSLEVVAKLLGSFFTSSSFQCKCQTLHKVFDWLVKNGCIVLEQAETKQLSDTQDRTCAHQVAKATRSC